MKLFSFVALVISMTFAIVANSMSLNNGVFQNLISLNESPFFKKNNIDVTNILNGFNGLLDNIMNIKNSIGMSATPNALQYMQSSETVLVTSTSKYHYFKSKTSQNTKALIFYPGAFVDEKAYAETMYKLAENGIDGFLVKMPLRMAIYGFNKGEVILKAFKAQYKEFYAGGHSMGGAAASIFAFAHKSEIKGLALLASFSILPLPQEMSVVSIIGTNDKVLKWDKYNSNLKNLPKSFTEVKIEGGNHGHFGDYGEQKGDGEATIPFEEQQEIVIKSIVEKFFY